MTWKNGKPDHHLGRALVLVPTLCNYIEWQYIKHLSENKCQNFEGTRRTLCMIIVPSNSLMEFPSVPYDQGQFFTEKTFLKINGDHKTVAAIDESDESNNGLFLPLFLSWLTCGACWFSGVGLPFNIDPNLSGGVCDFAGYIYFEVGEQKICHDCDDDIGGRGASQRNQRSWETELCQIFLNWRRINKKWRGQWLGVGVTRSV